MTTPTVGPGPEAEGPQVRLLDTQWLWMAAAGLAIVPGLVLVAGGFDASDAVRAVLFGLAIVGAAFLLAWAAEVVQLDFSQGLAIALLALIAVLPEYVVDASFAWLAAEDPAYAGYAVANMTGANRLLIGLAWPMVLLIAFWRFRLRRIELEPSHGLELVVLLGATLYAFTLPPKGTISLVDFVVLFALFAFYMWRLARLPVEAPHLVGPARLIGSFRPVTRRLVTAVLALGAAASVILVAKPFAKALVETGKGFGVDEFLLVQWLAPLASEAPEFVVVALFAYRGATTMALATLISSKVNQWTLLVGMLPLVYSIARGQPDALPLDVRQAEEVLLTAMQSLFAVSLLLNLRISLLGAALLFSLFAVQMVAPETRSTITWVYLILTLGVVIFSRREVGKAFQWVRS